MAYLECPSKCQGRYPCDAGCKNGWVDGEWVVAAWADFQALKSEILKAELVADAALVDPDQPVWDYLDAYNVPEHGLKFTPDERFLEAIFGIDGAPTDEWASSEEWGDWGTDGAVIQGPWDEPWGEATKATDSPLLIESEEELSDEDMKSVKATWTARTQTPLSADVTWTDVTADHWWDHIDHVSVYDAQAKEKPMDVYMLYYHGNDEIPVLYTQDELVDVMMEVTPNQTRYSIVKYEVAEGSVEIAR